MIKETAFEIWAQSFIDKNVENVEYDESSRLPTFIAYNTIKRKILLAKFYKMNHLFCDISTNVRKELEIDGYFIHFTKDFNKDSENKKKYLEIVTWY